MLTRHLIGMELSELAVGSQWHKINTNTILESSPTASDISLIQLQTQSSAILTANQSFNKASEVTKRLALVMTKCGSDQITKSLNLLKILIILWESGKKLAFHGLEATGPPPLGILCHYVFLNVYSVKNAPPKSLHKKISLLTSYGPLKGPFFPL